MFTCFVMARPSVTDFHKLLHFNMLHTHIVLMCVFHAFLWSWVECYQNM